MKYLLAPLLILGAGTVGATVASAQAAPENYPACSKTVQDECVEHTAAPAHQATAVKHARTSVHHRRHARAAQAQPHNPA